MTSDDPRDRQLRDARAEIDRLTTELADARMRLQALVAVVDLAASGLTSGLTQALHGDPVEALARDALRAPAAPDGAAEDAVRVPVLGVPMRIETPARRSVPADAPARTDEATTH